MNDNRRVTSIFVLIGFLLQGCLSVEQASTPIRKTPYLPPAEILEKLSLDMLWHAEVEAGCIRNAYLFRDLICLESESLELYGIDAGTGLIRWQTKLSCPLLVGPCDNSKQVFFIDGQRLVALEKTTGSLMWQVDLHFEPTAAPGACEEAVFVPVVGRAIRGYAAADGKRIFDFYARDLISASPVAQNGIVYFGDDAGWVYAVALQKKEILWEKKPRMVRQLLWERQTHGRIAAPVWLTEKQVLFGSQDYRIYVADKATGAPAWQNTTGSMVNAQPVCVEGLVFVPSYKNGLHVYDLAKGEVLWRRADGVGLAAAAGNKNVYVLTNENKVVALDKKTGAELWVVPSKRYDWVLPNPWTSPIFMASKDGRVIAIAEKGAKALTYTPPAAPPKPPPAKKAPPKPPPPSKKEEE